MSQGLERKSMTEKKKLVDVSIIQAHEEGSISLKHASIMLERTSLTVYCNLGADGLVHGNTGKKLITKSINLYASSCDKKHCIKCLTAWLFVIYTMKAWKCQ